MRAAVFRSDKVILPTGLSAVDRARVRGGATVAVWGAGPVGLTAMKKRDGCVKVVLKCGESAAPAVRGGVR